MQHYRAMGTDKGAKYGLSLEEKRLVTASFAKENGLRGVPAIRSLLDSIGHHAMNEDVVQGCKEIGFDTTKFMSEIEFLRLLELLKRRRHEGEPDLDSESFAAYAAIAESSRKYYERCADEVADLDPTVPSVILDPLELLRQTPIPQKSLAEFCEGFGLSFDEKELLKEFNNAHQLISYEDFKKMLELPERKAQKPKMKLDLRAGHGKKQRRTVTDELKPLEIPIATARKAKISPLPAQHDSSARKSQINSPMHCLTHRQRSCGLSSSFPSLTARSSVCTQALPPEPESSFLPPELAFITEPLIDEEDYSMDELDPDDRAALEAAYRRRNAAQRKAEEVKAYKARVQFLLEEKKKHRLHGPLAYPGHPPDVAEAQRKFVQRMERARLLRQVRDEELKSAVILRDDDEAQPPIPIQQRCRSRKKSAADGEAGHCHCSLPKHNFRSRPATVTGIGEAADRDGELSSLIVQRSMPPHKTIYIRLQEPLSNEHLRQTNGIEQVAASHSHAIQPSTHEDCSWASSNYCPVCEEEPNESWAVEEDEDWEVQGEALPASPHLLLPEGHALQLWGR